MVSASLTSLLGLGLLALSFSGFALWAHQKARIKTPFIPVLVLSCLICLLFLGAILHLLAAAAWLWTLAGLGLLLWQVLGKKQGAGLLYFYRNPAILLFVLSALFFLIYLRGGRLMIGDNFSHWALMAKYLYRENALPNHTSAMITYQAYPPGSALFLYYFTYFTGFTESRMLWAQLVLVLACLTCGFAAVEKPRSPQMALSLVCAFVMLSGGWSIFDLLVDTLYPALGYAALLLLLYYRDTPWKGALYALPVSAACLLVKNSGVFFALVHLLLVLFLLLRQKRETGWGKKTILAAWLACAPFLLLLLWNVHVDVAFAQGQESKHAMRVDSIEQGLGEKSPEDLAFIQGEFVTTTLSSQNRYTLVLGLWSAVMLGCALWFWKKRDPRKKQFLFAFVFGLGVWLLYLLALLAMYLTTMPLYEAVELASYHRYYLSIFIYLCGFYTWMLVEASQNASSTGESRGVLGLLAGGLALSLLLASSPKTTFARRTYEGTLFEVIDQSTAILEDRTDQYRYFVIGPLDIEGGGVMANTGGYIRYRLWVTAYDVRTPEYIAENMDWFLEQQHQYDMLLILEDNPFITQYMQQFPQYAGRASYVGMYNLPLW